MTAEKFKRKLTAILIADVKGYSRLMGEDEEWTLRTLNAYKEVMRKPRPAAPGAAWSPPPETMFLLSSPVWWMQ